MVLVGQRIQLSIFDDSDLPLYVEISMCPEMMEHVYEPLSFEEANEAFNSKLQPWSLESDSWLSFSLTELSTNDKVGNIGIKITNHDAKIAEVGFMIKRSAQGKGYASEALSLLKYYAFMQLNLNKLVATCSIDNTGSYQLLEKLGFSREGCLKQNVVIKGQYVDDYVYGLCKSAL